MKVFAMIDALDHVTISGSARVYETLLGRRSVDGRLQSGNVGLLFASTGPALASMAFATTDLDKAARLLERRAVATTRGARLELSTEASHGVPVALVERSTISVWTPDGSVIPGWPLTVDGQFASGCQPSPCMPGGNGATAPVVTHRDSAMYLVTYAGDRPETMQAQVVAFDTNGQPAPGFPLPIPELPCYPDDCPFVAPQVFDVQLTIDERVVVIASEGLFIVQ